MWLRNYYNMLTTVFLGDDSTTSSSTPTDYDPPIRVQLPNGTYRDLTSEKQQTGVNSNASIYGTFAKMSPITIGKSPCALVTNMTSSLNINGIFGLCLGSGSTPVTYDDYTMDTLITSGLSLVNVNGTLTQSSRYDPVTHKYSSVRSFTINNTSASPITISEFGITARYDYSYAALIYREVLATPVTLNPAESVIIEFTHDAEVYNYTPY